MASGRVGRAGYAGRERRLPVADCGLRNADSDCSPRPGVPIGGEKLALSAPRIVLESCENWLEIHVGGAKPSEFTCELGGEFEEISVSEHGRWLTSVVRGQRSELDLRRLLSELSKNERAAGRTTALRSLATGERARLLR
jgi:hypothetical protein